MTRLNRSQWPQEPAGAACAANAVRQVLDRNQSEAQFQEAITDLCDARGLLWMHVVDARGQHADGWPDLFIADARHGVAYAWELKTERGRTSYRQAEWIATLAQCKRLESGLYRPSDWETIRALLAR